MARTSRKSGIDAIGDIPWGKHFCQFYETKKDLIDILVPYFRAGLGNNECCIWITSDPLGVEDAKTSLREAVSNLDDCIKKGQIEILDYTEWYTRSGKFDADEVLQGWVEKEKMARRKGFEGLRLAGNTFWLGRKEWEDFRDYEATVNKVIGKYRIIAICSYPLDKCELPDIIEVINNHHFALLRREGKWVFTENIKPNQIRRQLADSEVRYRRLFETAQDGILILDTESGQIIDANPYLQEMLGYSHGELLGKALWDIGIFKDIHSSRKAFANLQDKGYIRYENLPLETKEGKQISVEFISNVYRVDGGRVIQCNIRDITERRRAEEALEKFKDELEILVKERTSELDKANQELYRQIAEHKQAEERARASETKYRILVENIPQKIFYKDSNLVYISCNSNYAQDLKITPDEIAGRTDYELYSKEIAEKYRADDTRIIESGHAENFQEPYLQDGQETIVETFKVPVRDEKGATVGVLGIFQDITERVRIEQELRKIDRLESTGTLAGGIAHDFNNLLTAITGNIQLAKKYTEAGKMDRASERFREAEKASLRARDLTQQLLTFAKGGAPIRKLVSISELVKESAKFALRGSQSRAEFSMPLNLWAAEVDEGQIGQVIDNIVINADQAMCQGGTININARNMVIKRTGGLPLPKGDYIEITIEDQGAGISKEHLKRIFEPYFTTKQKGSGLGLATVYSIIKNHGGYVTAESELGVGTKLHIYLPASAKPAKVEKEDVEAYIYGRGKIMVMDDEEMIRDMLHNELTELGYEIELAADGTEAIEKYAKAKESEQPFDAVILDLTIPGGQGGKETIRNLLKIDPDVKAIVSSGYGTSPIMSAYKKHGFKAVVTKPYSITEIGKTLHKVLKK